MTEIEQLREEIKILNQAAEIASRLDGCGCEMMGNIRARKMKEAELARLEAEAAAKVDPWALEKESVAKLCEPEIRPFSAHTPEETRRIRAFHAARYVKHLQNRVAELEAKLAQRPVVWCVRYKGRLLCRQCGCIRTFSDRERFMSPIAQTNFEPYTGEQS